MDNNNIDRFKDLINREREEKKELWKGTMLQYLKKVQEDSKIVQLAPARIYQMIMDKGSRLVTDPNRSIDDLRRYDFFEGELFGLEETLHELMEFFKAGAKRTETGKRILLLMGPVSSGKSTIATLLKRGLEQTKTPVYAIADCLMHEEPLHLIPTNMREQWEKLLNIPKIEGDLCPMCRHTLKDKYGEKWEDVPVQQIILSERDRTGIGTFQPSDPKNQDISELIGHVDFSKITQYGETDPRCFKLDGELEAANRGLIEYVEILKCDVKFHYTLLTVAQEQVLKAPGFPQIYTDLVIVSHTNQTEFEKFKTDKSNEALHDRIYVVNVPYNLRLSEEERIYQKLIDRTEFKKVHIAPYTLKAVSMFGILSRLKESNLCPDLIKKMKYHDGQKIMEKEKDPVDVKKLREEGKKQGEGMSGISPRFLINALNIALGKKEIDGCINPIDAIKVLKKNFDHHLGFSEEEKGKFVKLLEEEVVREYKEIAKKEVNRAFVHAYGDQAQNLFKNYLDNVIAYCQKKKIEDPISGEEKEPDEKLMRSIEEPIGISESGKKEFRQGILIFKGSFSEGESFNFESYQPLQEAIEKKIFTDLKDVVYLTVGQDSYSLKDNKTIKRKNDVLSSLKEKGYCPKCAEQLLQFVARILKDQE